MQQRFSSQLEKNARDEQRTSTRGSRFDALIEALIERFSDPVTLIVTVAAIAFGLWCLLNTLIAEHAEELSVILAKL